MPPHEAEPQFHLLDDCRDITAGGGGAVLADAAINASSTHLAAAHSGVLASRPMERGRQGDGIFYAASISLVDRDEARTGGSGRISGTLPISCLHQSAAIQHRQPD